MEETHLTMKGKTEADEGIQEEEDRKDHPTVEETADRPMAEAIQAEEDHQEEETQADTLFQRKQELQGAKAKSKSPKCSTAPETSWTPLWNHSSSCSTHDQSTSQTIRP